LPFVTVSRERISDDTVPGDLEWQPDVRAAKPVIVATIREAVLSVHPNVAIALARWP